MSSQRSKPQNVGKIVEIKGVVIDAVFPGRAAGDLQRAAIEIAGADGSSEPGR